ncbi:carcinoembryonic antigen-related cell adhesion molecule 5-like isoform X2 [Cyprinus carpio]|uniref:Carcinoembryonic antigen-related cell adhesion molecule 5-like isoform X2 n=1 Tax=Cyprinus carpio TaxID=7962 RepID=A0A9Q9X779_CYPCA|nr:carcinoembryonic antigen-related cell adhesion molecule 5-like isoform X2 [Cyprinus carpio]
MGHKVLAIFFTLICAPGLYAVFLVPSKNPVAVGTNVTISVNDTGTITVGLWLFGPSTLFMWYQGNMIQGTSLQNGTEFNNSTYQLTLSSVTLRNSGLYVLEAFTPIKARAEMTLDVQEPVSNVTSFVNMTNLVEFNDTVTFTCNASGTPLWFSWQNRSSIVTAGGRVELRNGGRELFINGVMRYDEGPFKCLVENNISKVETNQTNLNISYGPSNLTVTALPEKEAYISGSDIFLSCSADSKPTASFYWMYNGIHLNVSGSSYNLRNTTQNISGQYACVAKNAVTLRSVAVIKNIKVVDPILSVTVNPAGSPVEGNAFNLSCNVVGPVDSIHWMKNGTYLGANDMITFFNNNSTLSFYRLGLSDDGLYQCAASNAVSNITSKAYNLMVNYGPWNTTMSGPIVGVVGQNVTFSCSADSHPPSRYSWFLNVTKVGEGPVLTRALSPDSGGRYTCMASNEITGSSSNVSLELTLIYPVSHVIVNAGNQQPVFNQPFTLTCTASGDVEHIQWMKNSMFLYPYNGITFSNNNSTLSFQSLNLNDDGNYQCEASNSVSHMTSPAYDLMVTYGPWNTEVAGPRMAEMGSNVTFRCSAVSRPHSQYSWFYNNLKVGDGPVFVKAALSLTSSGQYTCMAFNNITGGSSSASLELTVIEAIVKVDVTADPPFPLASQSLRLTCNVTGAYNRLHWLQNNQNFQPSDRVTFSADNTTVTIKALQPADNGRYQCVASNSVRQHFSQPYNLAVIFGPHSVQITVTNGIPPVLTCLAESQPPAVYHWILENNTVGNVSSIVLPIKSIFGGNYTCVAKNPWTNITLQASQVVNYPDAAVSVQASVMLTALLILLIPVLDEWL